MSHRVLVSIFRVTLSELKRQALSMQPLLTTFRLLASVVILGATLRAEDLRPTATTTPTYDPASDTLCYVGTFTRTGTSKGIYFFKFETSPASADGATTAAHPKLIPLGLAVENINPSFLAVDAKRRLIFSANGTETFEGKKTGIVSAYSIDPQTGHLKLINQQPALGVNPCHLVLDKAGKNLVVANYGSGSVTVIPVAADGRLGEPTSSIQHVGKSVHPRQQGPHAHCVTLDPENKYAFVCDLGLDQILAYRFDADAGKLTPAEPAFTATKPAAGPRHLAFRPDGKFAYSINEMNSTVSVFAYSPANGALQELQTVSALPADIQGRSSGAEIEVHPSGKWLYVSNRGHDSVVVFDIDPAQGTVTFKAAQSSGGKTPRHFGFTPDATHLVVGNQESGTLLTCRIDQSTGLLTPLEGLPEVPQPACIVFLPPVGR
jgi:6-phosphogluconolactonase